jgi:hypothetical protein
VKFLIPYRIQQTDLDSNAPRVEPHPALGGDIDRWTEQQRDAPAKRRRHRSSLSRTRRALRYAPNLEAEIRCLWPGDGLAARAIRRSDGRLSSRFRREVMHVGDAKSMALLQAEVDAINALGADVVLHTGSRGPAEGVRQGKSAYLIIYRFLPNIVKIARRYLARHIKAALRASCARGNGGVGTEGAENVQATPDQAVNPTMGYRDGVRAQSRTPVEGNVEPVARETVTLRVEGVSKQPKTKDGRYLHLGMSTDGSLYGFFAPRQEPHSFVDACGALGALKKTKDGDDIVYMRGVTVTPRPDILDDRSWTTMPPDGKVLFYDVPAFSPWHPAEDIPFVPVSSMASDEPFVPFG